MNIFISTFFKFNHKTKHQHLDILPPVDFYGSRWSLLTLQMIYHTKGNNSILHLKCEWIDTYTTLITVRPRMVWYKEKINNKRLLKNPLIILITDEQTSDTK